MEELKIEVPQFVNEWFVNNVNKHGLYALVKKLLDSPNREEEYVYRWFEKVYSEAPCLEDEILFTLSNMAQFEYKVTPMYYIQAPDAWYRCVPLYMQYIPFTDSYSLTNNKADASKFTKEKALDVKDELKIDWELVEVGKNG